MSRTALVIQHLAFEGLGNLAPVLQAEGYQLEYRQAGVDALDMQPEDYDLWVILGGPIAAYDTADYPFLKTEQTLLATRIGLRKPVLGICLGAQLIAAACGARVYAGAQKEIGWYPIKLRASNSPLTHLLTEQETVLHWHGDTFDLPAQAELLASSAIYPHQAFRIGTHVLALQFHPEIERAAFEAWLIGHAGEIQQAGLKVKALRADAERYCQGMQAGAQRCWQAWLQGLSPA